MSDTPVTPPTPEPQPPQPVTPPDPPTSPNSVSSEITTVLAFLQNLLSNGAGSIRNDFNPLTPEFWTVLGSVAAICLAWVNPSNLLNTTVQSVITGIGGLVLAVFTHAATTKVPMGKVQVLISNLKKVEQDHPGLIAKAFTPTPLNPSPAGQIGAEGYYAPGTPNGSVLAPGAVVVVPSSGGAPGVKGTGGTTPGATNEGNVVSPVTINVQTGPYPTPNAESNLPLGTNVGNNSAEGTGGPVISNRQGGLGTGGSVEAPGAYVPPAPNQPNPDEASSTQFVARATEPESEKAPVVGPAHRRRQVPKDK